MNLEYGVPQGSILGPLLFLVMVADLPEYVTQETHNDVTANMVCYADDCSLYASSKSTDSLKKNLEIMSDRMIAYCSLSGLVINEEKTQMMCSGIKQSSDFTVRVGKIIIQPSKELDLLGITYDSNLITKPYLNRLATEAKTRAAIIKRLSYSVPPHLLRTFTNGLLIGKIMASAPAAIPYKIIPECTSNYKETQNRGSSTITEEINMSIKNAARTITGTKLSDKVPSKCVLNKAGLKSLNEMVASASAILVWKSKHFMDPLGKHLFPILNINSAHIHDTRSTKCDKIRVPVPGYTELAVNLMATAWNENSDLRNASTLGSAKIAAKKWAKTLST